MSCKDCIHSYLHTTTNKQPELKCLKHPVVAGGCGDFEKERRYSLEEVYEKVDQDYLDSIFLR